MFTEDLAVLFADFGVAATWTPSTGGAQQTATVIFDQPDIDLVSGMILSRDYKIVLPTSSFAGIDNGEVITVAGIPYTVREMRQQDDGALKELAVMK